MLVLITYDVNTQTAAGRKRLAKQLGLGSRSIEKNIKKLKDYGLLIRHGSPKNGHWEVTGGGSKKWQD